MKIKLAILCLSFFVLCFNLKSQTVRYVKPVSSGTGDGSSWANASSDLQTIINGSSANNEIWIAAGVYKPTQDAFGNLTPTDLRERTFHIKDSVKIYGGFIGNETILSQRNFNTNLTILNGDFNGNDVISGSGMTLSITGNAENAYHVVTSVGDSSATLVDGLVISGGNSNGSGTSFIESITTSRVEGGGLNLTSSKTTITNCTFENNAGSQGAGLNCTNSAATVSYCNLKNNKSTNTGGGMRVLIATARITNCNYSGNYSAKGGALVIASSSSIVSHCTFQENFSSADGGAINNNTGVITPQINDCVFYNNRCITNGSAISMNTPGSIQTSITNCTFFKNTGGLNGGTIYASAAGGGSCTPRITNCILWGNMGPGAQTITKVTGAVLNISNCIVQSGIPLCTNCLPTNGNRNPLFRDSTNVDGIDNILGTIDDGLFLQYTSPAIDTGSLSVITPVTDITGYTRTNRFDLGAYEYRCLPTASNTNLTICSNDLPLNWNGFVYSTAGTYIDTIPNREGCDSVLTLNLTVNNISTSTIDTIVCASNLPYTWHGLTFNASGTQTITLTNAINCDSIVSYHLVVYDGNSITNQTICSSELPFYWNGLTFNATDSQTATLVNYLGCDSLATLNLTVLNSSTSTTDLTLCSYDMPYTWNNIVFIGPGSQTASFTNSVGCDSVATLNLSVIDPTYLSITAFDETLIADETNATYQWISCDSTTNGNIPGETNQSFTATANGNYAVIVTTTTCSDTSGCFNIASVGIKNQERAANKITISPNPNNGSFTIDLKAESKIIITDALGRKVFEKTLQVGKQKVDLQNENNGVYLIHLIGNNYSQTGKLILNK